MAATLEGCGKIQTRDADSKDNNVNLQSLRIGASEIFASD